MLCLVDEIMAEIAPGNITTGRASQPTITLD